MLQNETVAVHIH